MHRDSKARWTDLNERNSAKIVIITKRLLNFTLLSEDFTRLKFENILHFTKMNSTPDLLMPSGPIPNHWFLLSDGDRGAYLKLRSRFYDEISKSKRGERIDIFIDRLNLVRAYLDRDESDKWKRCIVCGICFLESALAINIQQLRMLLGKCKSSINGSLQQLGYTAKPSTNEIDLELQQIVPIFKDDHAEFKKWTIRFGILPERIAAEMPYLKHAEEAQVIVPQKQQVSIDPDDAIRVIKCSFPCPIKLRYKMYDLFYDSISIQTEV